MCVIKEIGSIIHMNYKIVSRKNNKNTQMLNILKIKNPGNAPFRQRYFFAFVHE